jgi:hypothetical protein
MNEDWMPLAAAAEALVVPIRNGDGLSQEALDAFNQELAAAAAGWRMVGHVPIHAVATLVSIYPDAEAASYIYPDAEAEAIREAARQFSEYVLQCLVGRG